MMIMKVAQKTSARNWEAEGFSSERLRFVVTDVAKEQPHSPKMAREQGRSQVGHQVSLHSGLGWLCTVSHQVCSLTLGKGVLLILLLPASQRFHRYNIIKTVFSGGFSKVGFHQSSSEMLQREERGGTRASNKVYFILKVYSYIKDI